MKKQQKKSVHAPIITIIILLVIVAGLYVFSKNYQSIKSDYLQQATVFSALNNNVNGDSFVYSQDKSIEVVTSNYLAGAISALIWNGKQYIDDIGHGSSLQYTVSVDGLGESYNPTEAGGRYDDYNLRNLDGSHTTDLALDQNTMVAPLWATTTQTTLTSSLLSQFSVSAQTINTVSKMAFWLKPGSPSSTWTDSTGTHSFPPAANSGAISNYVLSKTVTIAPNGLSNVIKIDASLSVPAIDTDIKKALDISNKGIWFGVQPVNRTSPSISIEAPTGYLLKDFSRHYELVDVNSSPTLKDISQSHGVSLDNPYETKNPIIYSTQDNNYAMGVYSLQNTVSNGSPTVIKGPTYRTFASGGSYTNITKWVSVYNVSLGYSTSTLKFTTYLVVGKVSDVQARLVSLITGKPIPMSASCNTTSSSAKTGDNVIWNAVISGGTGPYTFYWNNSSTNVTDTHPSISGTSDSDTVTYNASGTKYMGLAVIDSKGQKADWAFCSNPVTVIVPPIPQNIPTVSSCAPTPLTTSIGSNVKWNAVISGGTGPYTFYWNNSSTNVTDTHPSISGTSDSDTVSYSTAGSKYMGLAVIDSKGKKADWAFCPGVVNVVK